MLTNQEIGKLWSDCPEWTRFVLTSFYRESEQEHAELIQSLHEFIAGWISDPINHSVPRIAVFYGPPCSGKTVLGRVLHALLGDEFAAHIDGRQVCDGFGFASVLIENDQIVVDPANDVVRTTPTGRKFAEVSSTDNINHLVRDVAHSETVEVRSKFHAAQIITLHKRLALMTNCQLDGLYIHPRRQREIIQFEMCGIAPDQIECSITQYLMHSASLVAIRRLAECALNQDLLPEGIGPVRNAILGAS